MHFRKSYEKELKKLEGVLLHDIKTPVLAQIQSLELLLGGSFGELNEEQREILEETLNSSYFLYRVVKNALLVCGGDVKIKTESVDIIDQIEECALEVKGLAASKGQTIVIRSDKKSIKLEADRKMMKKIILNFLVSSAEVGCENSDIEVFVAESEQGVLFKTKNKSDFMTKEKVEKLFEKKEDTRDFNSNGLSLSLGVAGALIKAHDWDIVKEAGGFGFLAKK